MNYNTCLMMDCMILLHQMKNEIIIQHKVIVTHGLALRLFLMRWFQFSVHDFEESYNPDNCELVTMTKTQNSEGHAWLELEEKNRLSLRLPDTVPRNVRLHRLQGLYDKDCGK